MDILIISVPLMICVIILELLILKIVPKRLKNVPNDVKNTIDKLVPEISKSVIQTFKRDKSLKDLLSVTTLREVFEKDDFQEFYAEQVDSITENVSMIMISNLIALLGIDPQKEEEAKQSIAKIQSWVNVLLTTEPAQFGLSKVEGGIPSIDLGSALSADNPRSAILGLVTQFLGSGLRAPANTSNDKAKSKTEIKIGY